MYSEYIIKVAPKVLSQIDRDKHSKNYGDCDRNHWHLKIRDFSSAILQQTGLAVALLYQTNFPGNIFYGRAEVKEWAEATVYYWKSIQLRDGSFNEYYPNEHGFPPTAFSLYAMCEVYKRLNMKDKSIEAAFKRTSQYLIRHIEEKAFNQEIASITALYSAYTILDEEWIYTGLNKKLERMINLQSDEGWFPEYGGADIGYLSVSLDMMAEYYDMSKDERVWEPLNKMISFLKYFVHPDGTIGGEYASRNTIYFLPNGLQIMANHGNATALSMLNYLYRNSERDNFFLDSVDDRYWSHYLLHSFLRATESQNICTQKEICELPFQYNQRKYFDKAGICSHTINEMYLLVGAKKGGVCIAFHKGIRCFEDFGYRVKLKKGCIATTNWQNDNYKIIDENNTIEISGYMNLVKQKIATPIMLMGLRVVSAVLGNKIISWLKRMIILVDKQTNIHYKREIKLEKNGIVLEDTINSPKKLTVECADGFSLRHVASGKFFSMSDISNHSRSVYEDIRSLKIVRCYNFLEDSIQEQVIEKV